MLPCLNLALSDVMANISQLEWQTGIKEIGIVQMAKPQLGHPCNKEESDMGYSHLHIRLRSLVLCNLLTLAVMYVDYK